MPKKISTTVIFSSSSSDSAEEISPPKHIRLKKSAIPRKSKLDVIATGSKIEHNDYNIYTRQIGMYANIRTNLEDVPNLDDNDSEEEDGSDLFGMLSNRELLPVSPKKPVSKLKKKSIKSPDLKPLGEKVSTRSCRRSRRNLPSTSIEVEDVDEICTPSPSNSRTKSFNTKIISALDENFAFLTGDCSDVNDSLKFDDTPAEEEMTVRIMCRTTLVKFRMKMNQKFFTIKEELGQILKANVSDISILLDNEAIRENDSPATKNLQPYDILTCLASCSTAVSNGDHKVLESDDENYIEVVIQSTLQQRKQIPFKCNKTKPLKELASAFAIQNSIDESSITMKFDGDVVDLEDSAADLDMESGDCIDFIIR